MGVDPHERTGDPSIDWTKVKPVSDAELAFPAKVIDKFLPPYDTIPDEHKHRGHPMGKVVSKWFFGGLPQGTQFHPREGIDAEAAFRQVRACLGSYEPAHEHKEAGVSWLLDLFFEKIEFPEEEGV